MTSPETNHPEMLPGDYYQEITDQYGGLGYHLISPIRAARYGLQLIADEQAGIRPKVPDDVNDPYYKMCMPAINP